MSITSAIVLFAVCWFMVFLIVLPLRLQTQGEAGEVVNGTHSFAPANPQIAKRAKITTGIAAVLWVALVAVILSGNFSIRDIDWFDRMGPPSDRSSDTSSDTAVDEETRTAPAVTPEVTPER